MKSLQKGFTLVELLIAIVVIAILSSISVVAYNGVQQRAYSSTAASALDSYLKIIEMYRVEHGRYPPAGGYRCLSEPGSLPAKDGFAEGVCYEFIFSGEGEEVAIDTEFMALLKPYAVRLPGALPVVRSSGDGNSANVRSLIYWSTHDGSHASIEYGINGDYECPRGDKYAGQGFTGCRLQLAASSDTD